MDFEPINEDHAIEEVIFGCHLGRRLTPVDIRHFASLHHTVAEELPAIVVDPESPHAANFAYLRPNGTPTWALQLAENNITVGCTRYTRWQKVWDSARQYMLIGLNSVQAPDRTNVAAISITTIDKFYGVVENPDISTLLCRSELVMPAAFDLKTTWHSHVGWFDENHPNWKTLNHLNIDLRREDIPGSDAQRTLLLLQHTQRLIFDDIIPLEKFLLTEGLVLVSGMAHMHNVNKSVLDRVLRSEMKERIQLSGSK